MQAPFCRHLWAAWLMAPTVCLVVSGECSGQIVRLPAVAETVVLDQREVAPPGGGLPVYAPSVNRPPMVTELIPFQDRLERQLRAAGGDMDYFRVPPLPAGFTPWWQPGVTRPQRQGAAFRTIELDALLSKALQFSPQVQAIRETDFIRSTAIVEAEAEFDWHVFMESKFIRSSDPVGDDLTTGGPPRFRDSTWYYLAGARKRTHSGATLELSQRDGYRDNNSLFLNPTQQGNTRLSLAFTQPLLNGAGHTYNQSRIVLAQLDTRVARDEVAAGLQKHLVEVTQAYWDLFLRRAVFLQKQRHHLRAREILGRLEDRRHLDALESQILAARAAVSVRYADLNRAAMAIRNAESRIRTLVSAPALFAEAQQEFIPAAALGNEFFNVSLRDALATALYHRPDIDRALQRTRMAGVRLNMSTKELLPVLNMVLETYVAGLEGRSQIGQAWLNQFSVGEPGYTAGLVFEVPLHNRAARARYERRQAELRQVTSELRATVDTAFLEVEIAVRAVQTAYQDILANYRSMTATQADVNYLRDRWTSLPGDDRSASFLLEDLLNAQDRLASAEFSFVEVQTIYTMAQVRLKQAMGVLLAVEDLSAGQPAVPVMAEELQPSASTDEGSDLHSTVIHRLPPVR